MTHNFLKKIAETWDQEKYPPDLYDVTVAHDDWCAYLDTSGEVPGECNCDPDIMVKEIERMVGPGTPDAAPSSSNPTSKPGGTAG